MSIAPRLRFRLLRHPLPHFLLLGGALLAVSHAMPEAKPVVVVPAARIAAARAHMGAAANDPEAVRRVTELLIAEAVLADEAQRRGMTASGPDDVVRRTLAQQMRAALAASPEGGEAVSDADVRAWADAHRRELETPARYTVDAVPVLDPGSAIDETAAAIRARLVAGAAPADVTAAPLRLADRTQDELARQIGTSLAEACARLTVGAWSAPIKDAHGRWILRVAARTPPALPPLEALRPRAESAIAAERADARVRDAVERLRAARELRVESAAS